MPGGRKRGVGRPETSIEPKQPEGSPEKEVVMARAGDGFECRTEIRRSLLGTMSWPSIAGRPSCQRCGEDVVIVFSAR